MPPRSTNAPKSAMFLTMPLRIWPTSMFVEQLLLGLVRAAPRCSLRRQMTMLRRSSSILRILASISWPMNSPMSPGRRMSTWQAGRKTGTPMSTSRPPLILRMTRPLTASPSLVVSTMRSQSRMRSALRLERTHQAAVGLDRPRASTSIVVADVDRRAVVPLVEGDDAFALEADVDDHVAADDADDAALEDGIRREVVHRAAELFVHGLRAVAFAEGLLELAIEFLVRHADSFEESRVSHAIIPSLAAPSGQPHYVTKAFAEGVRLGVNRSARRNTRTPPEERNA